MIFGVQADIYTRVSMYEYLYTRIAYLYTRIAYLYTRMYKYWLRACTGSRRLLSLGSPLLFGLMSNRSNTPLPKDVPKHTNYASDAQIMSQMHKSCPKRTNYASETLFKITLKRITEK